LEVYKNYAIFAAINGILEGMTDNKTGLTLSGLDPKRFESVVDGKQTHLWVLTNKQGAEMCVTNYGGIVPSIMMPDRKGRWANVVLGMEDIGSVVNGLEPFLGATIGRYGNRIAGARFVLDGQEYKVTMNQAPNCLHGGKGFHARMWEGEQTDAQTLVLRYTSADGEEGFPGELKVEMTYCLTDDNEFRIDYKATTSKTTVCNLTNHAFFNLAGIQKVTSSVEDNILYINADRYCPIDGVSIPFGEKAPVEGTPFDFRKPTRVGDRIDADCEQTKNGAGYDHSFCLNKSKEGELTLAAICEEPVSGRTLTVYTTEPGIQLYTGNWLSGFEGQHGCTYPRRSAICFEAQHHPDSPNKPQFESTTLRPGETYTQTTVYRFGVR
jgi:aldose 1-epimerase